MPAKIDQIPNMETFYRRFEVEDQPPSDRAGSGGGGTPSDD